MTDSRPRVTCPICNQAFRLNARGEIVKHCFYGLHCEGSYRKIQPVIDYRKPGKRSEADDVHLPTPAERISELREAILAGKITEPEAVERAKRTICQLRAQI